MSLLEDSSALALRLSKTCIGEKNPVMVVALATFLNFMLEQSGGLPDLQERLTLLRVTMLATDARIKAATN